MAEVIFFASIRESLGCDRLSLEIPENTKVSTLVEMLTEVNGEAWREALTAENVRIAVNQELISGDETLSGADEIAFFPPVTGG